jgi:F-type H+-transporting ATPase subunit c
MLAQFSLDSGLGFLAAAFGAALVLFSAAWGISRLAVASLEGTARQPEAGGTLRTTMIIAAALIEGLALFALVICLLVNIFASDVAKLEAEVARPDSVKAPAEDGHAGADDGSAQH